MQSLSKDHLFSVNDQYSSLFELVDAENGAYLSKVLFCSPFVADLWLANPRWCQDFFASEKVPDWCIADIGYENGADEAGFMRQLRRWRMRHMATIAARDLLAIDSEEQACLYLSQLADKAIIAAQEYAIETTLLQPKYAGKTPKALMPSLMTVGMGKLGGYELNYSSDIDIIFFYEDAVAPTPGVEWPVFFTLVAQKIIKYIGAQTEDGFVFRVDVRLRPFGDSGALVLSLAAAENYYTTHGRDWERYALIKARIITGTVQAKDALSALLIPFVYRRYLDFSALNALRDLKARIVSGYSENKIKDHIKLGRGGIREVEFLFQLWQLTYGGKEFDLRTTSLVQAANVVVKQGLLDEIVVESLLNAYWFLRKAENSVQIMRDQQVHSLPTTDDDKAKLTAAMGFEHYDDFLSVLQRHQDHVIQHFDLLLYVDDVSDNGIEQCKLIWLSTDNAEATAIAQKVGYLQPELVVEHLLLLKNASAVRRMSETAKVRLDEFIPVLLKHLLEVDDYHEQALTLWKRLQLFLKQIALRSTYFVMLTERPKALIRLLNLMVRSAWIADSISQYPAMLDTLLDPVELDQFSKLALDSMLQDGLNHADDMEMQMQEMRKFKHETVMKLASADLNNVLPLMKVSDALTSLAECLLGKSMELAKQPLVALYGEPSYTNGEQLLHADMAVIAYGKMGGQELSYDSDLDVVFLHNSHGSKEYTNGDKSIDNTTFFARWVQKTLHYLNTLTHNGRLYEVDMRLRPNGAAGTLANRVSGFAVYLEKDAWLWELQALVRARFVAGNPEIGAQFETIRKQVLCQPRNATEVMQKVVDMRLLMRKELGSKSPRNTLNSTYQSIKSQKSEQFDLKHDFGGIADIEFMVQYAVLANAAETPALADYTDNIRLLEIMGEQAYMSTHDAQSLIAAYQLFRETIHHRSLQNQDKKIVDISSNIADAIDMVSEVWLKIMK